MLITKHWRLHSGVCYTVVVWQGLFGDVGGTSYIRNSISEDIFPKRTIFSQLLGPLCVPVVTVCLTLLSVNFTQERASL